MFPSSRFIICYTLPSTDIALFHWYYDVIRLLNAFGVPCLLRLVTSYCRSRAIEFSHVYVLYYCISCRALRTPGTFYYSSLANNKILTSTPGKASSFPTTISELNHFNLMAYGLISGLPTLNYLRHLNSPRLTLWLFAKHYHTGFPPALHVRTSWRTPGIVARPWLGFF